MRSLVGCPYLDKAAMCWTSCRDARMSGEYRACAGSGIDPYRPDPNPDFPPGDKHFIWRDTVGDRTVSTIFLPVLGEYETAVLTKREGKPSRYSRFLRATDKEEARKNHVKTLKSLTG